MCADTDVKTIDEDQCGTRQQKIIVKQIYLVLNVIHNLYSL